MSRQPIGSSSALAPVGRLGLVCLACLSSCSGDPQAAPTSQLERVDLPTDSRSTCEHTLGEDSQLVLVPGTYVAEGAPPQEVLTIHSDGTFVFADWLCHFGAPPRASLWRQQDSGTIFLQGLSSGEDSSEGQLLMSDGSLAVHLEWPSSRCLLMILRSAAELDEE